MTHTSNPSPRARYWRSLSELQQTPEFEQFLHREFPVAASEFPEGVSRRRWLQLMGASLAMGGVVGCRYPEETIAPFVIRPDGRVPGEAYSRATNFALADRVYHLAVSCVDGRPLKIEGNPDHPTGRGGTDAYVQASMLGLYDPDRKSAVTRPDEKGRPTETDWADFERYGQALVGQLRQQQGRGLAVLVGPMQSPSQVRMLSRLRAALPEATICRFDPVRLDVMRQATTAALGRPADQLLNLDQASVVLTLQADVLGQDRNFIRNARLFADRRDPVEGEMSRLYTVEAGYSGTGAAADSRLALRPSEMIAFLAELERRLDALGDGGNAVAAPSDDSELPFDKLSPQERLERFLDVASADLAAAGEQGLVVVGEHLGADAVAAGIRINSKLGSLGSAVQYTEPVDASLEDLVSIDQLVDQIQGGRVNALLVLANNPVFTAPADLNLAAAIARVRHTIYLGEYDDETARVCKWALPAGHPLETWGDCVSDDGYYGVCQPQILPLLSGRTALEVIAVMLGEEETDGQAIVRRTADEMAGGSLSNRQWLQLLHDGYSEDIRSEIAEASYTGGDQPLAAPSPRGDVDLKDDIEIVWVPSESIYDGRFANNGWLQELPQSISKITWDNAALMSPRTARELGVRQGVLVALRRGDTTVELPVYEMPGMAAGAVVVPYGYGRHFAGAVGGHDDLDVAPVGTDVSSLRISDAMLVGYQMEARPRSTEYELAVTQDHWAIDELGRDETEDRSFRLVREGTVELLDELPAFAAAKGLHVPEESQLWDRPMERIEQEKDYLPQWGMSIDLSKCYGCNACVVACQSENNVPIVGREQVIESREMHWLRIDRYFQGDEENADVVQEPMACVHCETAPCEQVCPVAATLHTDDGINAMAYNRCIGTRYCANNCPFKVRRFNYFNFNKEVGVGYGIDAFPGNIESANRKLQQLVLNPEVTVRGRGVMEKCTYCIQRVEQGKIEARVEGRPIRDGDVQTACQTACPTRAIVFGNIHDTESEVYKKHHDPRNYTLLEQLRVKPRTVYLARIRNPHPRLMTSAQIDDLQTLLHHGEAGGHGEDGHGEAGHAEDNHARAGTAAHRDASV